MRRVIGIFIMVALPVLLLMACTPAPKNGLRKVKIPPERSYHRGYSLIPLNEEGWLIGQSDPNQLILMRYGDRQGETFVIRTSILGLPKLESQEELMDYIEKMQVEGSDPTRFTYVKRDITPYLKREEFCTRFYSMVEDHAAVTRPGVTENMILEIVALTCRHPENENVAIDVSYSHRHHPDHRDSLFLETAEMLFESVEFTDL